MIARISPLPKGVPVLLSILAGYVDSCTFLALFGLFVAQVTGSFVLAGTQLVQHEQGGLVKLLAIPIFFIGCIVATVLTRSLSGRDGLALAASLALETMLLAGLFVALLVGAPFAGPDTPAAVFAAMCGLGAMGLQSALVRLVRGGLPSTNVMTMNSTQFAIDVTELVMTSRARRAAPEDAARVAEHDRVKDKFDQMWPILLGFLGGTIAGALAYAGVGHWCVLAAITLALALTAWAARRAAAPASA